MAKILLMCAVLVLLWGARCWAIIPVIDESEIVQSIAMVNNSLQQVQQQADLVIGQAQQITQGIKQLTQLPTDYVNQITGTLQEYYDLLNQGQQLAFKLSNAPKQFDDMIATLGNKGMGVPQRLAALTGQIRDVGRIATQVQALYEYLCGTQATVNSLVKASQAAPGSLAAQQATNQLLGVLSQQQGTMQELMAANGRLQVTITMQQQMLDQAGADWVQEKMGDWPTTGMRPLGQGQGPKLP